MLNFTQKVLTEYLMTRTGSGFPEHPWVMTQLQFPCVYLYLKIKDDIIFRRWWIQNRPRLLLLSLQCSGRDGTDGALIFPLSSSFFFFSLMDFIMIWTPQRVKVITGLIIIRLHWGEMKKTSVNDNPANRWENENGHFPGLFYFSCEKARKCSKSTK